MLSYGNLHSRYFNANSAGENRLMTDISFSRRICSCIELTASHIIEALDGQSWLGGRVKKGLERRKANNSFKLDSTACYITFPCLQVLFSHKQTLIIPTEGQLGRKRFKAEKWQSHLRATQLLCGLTRLLELPSLVAAQTSESV